ncbi:MAG: primosomal protein N' [Oscillospiraceae bacterium]|nr:primosomal protein N' [Oscillospiraceae bacterium]
MSALTAKIAVSAATYRIDLPYDYAIPEELEEKVRPGVRVTVPFSAGNRRTEGVVIALTEKSEFTERKNILSVIDVSPVLTDEQIKLALWMRERYFCTVFDAVRAMLPAGLWYKTKAGEFKRSKDKEAAFAALCISAEEASDFIKRKRKSAPHQAAVLELLCATGKASVDDIRELTGAAQSTVKALVERELIEIETEEIFQRPKYTPAEALPLPDLNDVQEKVYRGLSELSTGNRAAAALLFGVTGSGKTAVYIRLIDKMLKSGKSSILLVPEISLTPQMISAFSSYFGENIAVLHSLLSVAERRDEWRRVKSGAAKIVTGTRSAVFAPVSDLGMIIIDEEQDDAYKSGNSPRYHAREVAKYRCMKSNALLLFGSATPDIETMYSAEKGKYLLFSLPERYNCAQMPNVETADMKRELRRGNNGNLSSVLIRELEANIIAGEQSILFLNRRGTSKLITCVECGFTYKCRKCSVNLTYHASGNRLICHYCGHSERVGDECPDCGGIMSYTGAGTQKIEEEIKLLFNDLPVIRMDSDSVAPTGSHETILERFRSEKIPVMIGTQMITKGLDFENVTLVGIISADQSLYAGNHKSNERAFSLLTQVIGRSGRGERPGRAVIQTFTPDNQIIKLATNQDYEGFYRSEIEVRRLQNSPPFSEIYAITASGDDENRVLHCCSDIRAILTDRLRDAEGKRVLGPAPLTVVKVNNKYRYRVLLICEGSKAVRELVSGIIKYCGAKKEYRGISVFADVNPAE